ncbi:Inositol oxygenase 4 [Camellia lanceoleosa]|uniref:Inositol oxygenase 4 n=1 Tax=Camellia lanceoleosa TaxID=1840588 RepID=A0ACC0ILZ8_9ERIC|nr:Inositol oxygenase 4 [Camellia lanceoleosa]
MFQKEKFVEHNANAVAAGRIIGIDPLEQITKRCDTFPLGCAFDESIVHHKIEYNLYSKNSTYNTKNGIYSEGCGLDNVMISWGHSNYMYLVAKENGMTLAPAALFIIQYHSFYPLHKSGGYTHLMNADDVENLKWLKIFNKYDLYSKSKVCIDVEKVKPYYLSLIEKFLYRLSMSSSSKSSSSESEQSSSNNSSLDETHATLKIRVIPDPPASWHPPGSLPTTSHSSSTSHGSVSTGANYYHDIFSFDIFIRKIFSISYTFKSLAFIGF